MYLGPFTFTVDKCKKTEQFKKNL